MMEAVKGYRNIVVECPTGSGKSALAKSIVQAFGVLHIDPRGLHQYLKEMPYMKWHGSWKLRLPP